MGTTAIIQSPAPDPDRSEDFYQRAGFERVGEGRYRDGDLLIQLETDPHARAALKLVAPDWSEALGKIEQTMDVFEHEGTHMVMAPSGLRVLLVEGEDASRPGEVSKGRFGTFAGMSLETISVPRELEFWSWLGYGVTGGGADQGWVSLGNDSGMDVSVMPMRACPHLFPVPGLTYFNSGKNPEVIAAIREAGIPIAEEITRFNEAGEVDNIIVQDPGGVGFFIFND